MPFIREKFPKLAKQYEQWYAKNGYAPEDYRKTVSQRVHRIRERYGFLTRPSEGMRTATTRAQMSLGWDVAARSEETPQMRAGKG